MLNNPMAQMMINSNPQMRQFMNMMQNAQNPMGMFQQRYGNDPAYQKTINAANGKNSQEFHEYVINTCKSKGQNPREYLSQFGIQI